MHSIFKNMWFICIYILEVQEELLEEVAAIDHRLHISHILHIVYVTSFTDKHNMQCELNLSLS